MPIPARFITARVADISRVLDPNTRSAKVRIVLPNRRRVLAARTCSRWPFSGRAKSQSRLVVPSASIMRLQDKDWVFRKEGPSQFRKVEVHAQGVTADGMQRLQDGPLKPGDELVANALEFSTAIAEQGK